MAAGFVYDAENRLVSQRCEDREPRLRSARPGDGTALRLNVESTKQALSGIDGLAWLPTGPKVLMDMLAWCGFPHSRLDYQLSMPNGRDRLQIVAAREAAALADYDAAGAESAPEWASMKPSAVKRLMAKLRR